MNDSRSLEIDRLVDTYADTILRLCYTYLHSTADAEDLCQNVLLKLMERKKPFVNEEHEKAWGQLISTLPLAVGMIYQQRI